MSLLQILDTFQEGRSHMAIVSRYSQERAASIKHEVKKGLTERLKERVGMGDSSSSESDTDSESESETGHDTEGATNASSAGSTRNSLGKKWKRRFSRKSSERDVEKGEKEDANPKEEKQAEKEQGPTLPQSTWARLLAPGREQAMPDDAVLPKDQADEVCSNDNWDVKRSTDVLVP